MRLLLYALLMVLLPPVLLLGFLLYMFPIALRRGEVSGTTYEPFNGQLLYHGMGKRPDAAAVKLAACLPATNGAFLLLMLRPLVWSSSATAWLPYGGLVLAVKPG